MALRLSYFHILSLRLEPNNRPKSFSVTGKALCSFCLAPILTLPTVCPNGVGFLFNSIFDLNNFVVQFFCFNHVQMRIMIC